MSDIYGVPTTMLNTRRHLRRNSSPGMDVIRDEINETIPKPLDLSRSKLFSPASSILHSPIAMSPSSSSSSIRSAARTHQYRMNAAQEQRTYHESCQRLLSHIASVTSICDELYKNNKNHSVYYPPFPKAQQQRLNSTRLQPQRSMTTSFISDSMHLETASQPDMGTPSSIVDSLYQRRSSVQSDSLPSLQSSTSTLVANAHASFLKQEFNILHLDLKVGHATTNLHSTLEQSSIANLLEEKLLQCKRHLDNLYTRVADTSSKVLVTGDLNAGKSTFVNALLKRELLPADQQPCTNMFCEVLDANLNDGVEQMHAIPQVENYDRLNPATYHVVEMRHLDKLIMDDYEQYQMVKIYTNDARNTQESLLHNGVVDIALIDSPGLNTDSVKTTAVFARQEEIDVVVFVVSAENHFTLSGKEFLWNAANEKTHIFIVVNRFDSIRDKDRCKRNILEQIRQLSPATYQDADDLVHFVSAGDVDLEPGSRKLDAPDFARLEERLRAFVLGNRTKSKLLPAKNYLVNLLLDIGVLSEANQADAAAKYQEATTMLEKDLPAYEQLLRARDRMLNQVERMAETTVTMVQRQAMERLQEAAEQVQKAIEPLEYPGFFLLWQYAQDLCESMAQAMVKEIRAVEQQTRQDTQHCLDNVHQVAEEQLGNFPRVANVDGMFLRPRDRRLLIQVETTDFFDFVLDDKLSGCALSVGAAAMVGGRLMGFKDAVSSLWNMSTMLGAQNMRRMALPVIGIASAGLLIYVVADMRNAVERKLVRKFKQAVRDQGYVETQSHRIGRDTRKMLRVEGWEIQSRLQKAIETKEQKRNEMEFVIQTSQEAMTYFTSLLEKSTMMLDKVELVQIEQSRIDEPLKI
ncbi:uncharacterized protein BX664DRAFT_293845 [Halteromyces radiatus]|uniref:uncharacterized protein n=1 Tax=Halteromyces radiatus TaxID=101107 RepID=UPI00221F5121|nr:uncharacterized protein BX664DRAFT_293845 [Halteromyces radiatus]KAI8092655.1 hypothetical protein BX664DRAFT_293845 [Halteromyces radiatus]